MALETIAALSLAGNIVQFVDFGCRLFSKSRELYKSSEGALDETVELEKIATSLSTMSEGLTKIPPLAAQQSQWCQDEITLKSIAQGCKKIADELLEALDELRVKNSKMKWQSFRVALKRIWRSGKIESMSRKLVDYSVQLTTCMVKILQ